MKYRKTLSLIMVLLFVFVLAACGGSSNNQQATQRPAATATTASSSAGGGALSVEDEFGGTISVTLPANWVGDDEGGLIAANSEAALRASADPSMLESGQVVVLIDYIPVGSPLAEALGVSNSSLPAAVIAATVNALNDNERGEVYEAAAQPRMTVNRGHQIGTSFGTLTIGDAVYAIAISVKKVPNVGFARMISMAPEGQIDQYTGTLNNIAGSISYEAAESE